MELPDAPTLRFQPSITGGGQRDKRDKRDHSDRNGGIDALAWFFRGRSEVLRGVVTLLTLMMIWSGLEAASAEFKLDRFEGEIRKFESRDATNPSAPGVVLFTGSSSVVKWGSLSNDFAGLPVLNRGFGGSTWRELNYYFLRIVPKYQPRAVVVYEGDNDLAMGRSVAECLADFEAFRDLMRAHLPGVPVAVLAVKPSPSRRHLLKAQAEINAQIRQRLAGQPNWVLLDVASVLLDAAGEPVPELFESDRLHLKSGGYARWLPVVKPWVVKFGGP